MRILHLLFLSTFFCSAEEVVFKGTTFRIVRAAPEKVRIALKDEKGKFLHSLRAAKRHFEKEGEKVTVIMNGGIYEPGLVPSGLYVENGKVLYPLNLKPGKGNFFLKPNGVFLIGGKPLKASVVTSKEYQGEGVQLAVQSGPILLRGGRVHPAFNEGSKSKLVRNGVGVDAEGRVVFALADRENKCNLWTFAKLFEHLGCKDALYLDGTISKLELNPKDGLTGQGFATMLAIVE
ncbi:phosphodiester glycosidase family protein [Akkermansiaceae bacterium]|nr:phosphodiester glycosidase family protein [Akkermansiaceae bacterium]